MSLAIDVLGYSVKCLPRDGVEGLEVLTEECRAYHYTNGSWVEIPLTCEFIFLNMKNCQAYWIEKKCCEKRHVSPDESLIDAQGNVWLYNKCIGCWILQPVTPEAIGGGSLSSDTSTNLDAIVPKYIGLGLTDSDFRKVWVKAATFGIPVRSNLMTFTFSAAANATSNLVPKDFPTFYVRFELQVARAESDGSVSLPQTIATLVLEVENSVVKSNTTQELTTSIPIRNDDLFTTKISLPALNPNGQLTPNITATGTFTTGITVISVTTQP